jgi:hypothetical protein
VDEISKLTERLKGADHAATQRLKEGVHEEETPPDKEKKGKGKTSKNGAAQSLKAIKERTRFTMSVSYIGGLLAAQLITLSNDEIPPDIKLSVIYEIANDRHY